MICLDNSVLTRFASKKRYPAVEQYLSEHATEPWTIPATVAYEYYTSTHAPRSSLASIPSRISWTR